MGAVVAEARRLTEKGFAEIVLTGVDLTSYGADLPGTPILGTLVAKLLKLVPGLKRLRLSSINSIEADAALMRAIAEEERLMPHFHLSAQSGDDMILKRMKRRHGRADTIAFCETVRRYRPEAAFGADLIAGFPTETEAMFENSLKLVDDAGLSQLHVFPFSARARARRPRKCRNWRRAWSRNAPRGCAPRASWRATARLDAMIGTRHDRAGGERRLSATRPVSPVSPLTAPRRGSFVPVTITGRAADGHLTRQLARHEDLRRGAAAARLSSTRLKYGLAKIRGLG